MLITGSKKLCGVFGWNIALEWGQKWALKRKNSRKNTLVFSSLAKSAMNWCLVAVFSHWYWVHLEEKLQEDIQETAWKNTEVFLWSSNIFNNSSLNTFPGISQNLPENVSIFFAKNDRPMSADSEKPNITGGNWTKYCTMAKSVGRGRPIWTSVVVRARGSINSGRHILESRCAERCANDAFSTSFRATLTDFWYLSMNNHSFVCILYSHVLRRNTQHWTCISAVLPQTKVTCSLPGDGFPWYVSSIEQLLVLAWLYRPRFNSSAPSDPFENNFLHIHSVIVVVDLITKTCCRMYKAIYVCILLPQSLFSNSSSTADSRSYFCQKITSWSTLHWKSWKRGGGGGGGGERELEVHCFVNSTWCLSTSRGPGKHTDLIQ